jgi:hypothetical protein
MTTTRTVAAGAVERPAGHSASARRLPRGRRTVAAVLVALVLLLLAGFAAWQAIIVQLGQRPYPFDAAAVSARLNQTPWSDGAVVAVGSAMIVLGLWLVLLAVVPSRRGLVELREDQPDVTTGIRATDLRRSLSAAAERIDGISAATTSIGRGVASVTVTSPLGNPAGLIEKVTAEITEQLAQLDPRDPLTPRVTLVQGGRR